MSTEPQGHAADLVLAVLREAASAVKDALSHLTDWGLAGTREGQYRSDLVADAAALSVLTAAGLGAFSEESGLHRPEASIRVVLDPVDGSTNASRGLPWWATSLCALDEEGPYVAVVVNQATGQRFEAIRGGGATCDDKVIFPSGCREMSEAIVAVSGYPEFHLGWSQFRSLGAAALDICAVASGSLDVFVDFAAQSLAPWDYLGGMLVCMEAGASVGEPDGLDLVVRSGAERRTFVAAASRELLDEAVELRRRAGRERG